MAVHWDLRSTLANVILMTYVGASNEKTEEHQWVCVSRFVRVFEISMEHDVLWKHSALELEKLLRILGARLGANHVSPRAQAYLACFLATEWVAVHWHDTWTGYQSSCG
jgi:hypothetical protein